MNKNEIIERLGADDWAQVKGEFEGKTLLEIRKTLSDMWPQEPEENKALAGAIFDRFNWIPF